jgi:Na+/pantothenate symporter
MLAIASVLRYLLLILSIRLIVVKTDVIIKISNKWNDLRYLHPQHFVSLVSDELSIILAQLVLLFSMSPQGVLLWKNIFALRAFETYFAQPVILMLMSLQIGRSHERSFAFKAMM